MKFVCNKQELLKGINTVIKATYTKFQKSILECIHIVAGSTLTLDAFDTVTAIRTNIYSDIEEAWPNLHSRPDSAGDRQQISRQRGDL